MKTYDVMLNFTEYIEAESEEDAILAFSEKYKIREKYLCAYEAQGLDEEDDSWRGDVWGL